MSTPGRGSVKRGQTPEFDGRDPRALSKAAEEGFKAESNRRSFRFLLAYIGVQVLYLAFYFLASQNSNLNYVPLLADSFMLAMHCVALTIRVKHGLQERDLYKWFMTFALVVDTVLFAFVDPVVEAEIVFATDTKSFFDTFGGVPTASASSIPHPYKSNLFFQFHCLYMSLMVLSFYWSVVIMPICMALYSTIIIASYRSSYHRYTENGIEVSQDKDDLIVEVLLMWFTLFLGLCAKRSLEQAQRPLFFALEAGKDEIIKEKVKRCHAEFAASGLQDKMDKVLQQTPIAPSVCSVVVADEVPVRTVKPLPPASVTSAPAATNVFAWTRGKPRRRTGGAAGECTNDDCLPSTARVWVESQAVPQRLGTVKAGQRVLCYDSLSKSLKYTGILEVSLTDSSECTEWVTVGLQDGTCLEMTSNHPVECFLAHSPDGSSRFIPAGNIEAEQASIRVLKTELVKVCDVRRCSVAGGDNSSSRKPPEWVDIRVQHPDRHTVFVAQGNESSPSVGMAVGTPQFLSGRPLVSVSKTFINVENSPDDVTSDNWSSRHTASAPDLNGHYAEAGIHELDLCDVMTATDSSPCSTPRRITLADGIRRIASQMFGSVSTTTQAPSTSPSTHTISPRASSANSVCGGAEAVDTTDFASSGASAAPTFEGKRPGGLRRERQRQKKRSTPQDKPTSEMGSGALACEAV